MSAVQHRFGPYGGQYVPETLMPALAELEQAWVASWADAGFRAELDREAGVLGTGDATDLDARHPPQPRGGSASARLRSPSRPPGGCPV